MAQVLVDDPQARPGGRAATPVTAPWPGVQIYHPVVTAQETRADVADLQRSAARLHDALAHCAAATLILDLEDGCRLKEASRALLAAELARGRPRDGLQRALRINPVESPEHPRDLALLADIAPHLDVVMLAKAGETGDPAEVAHVAAAVARIDPRLTLQPVIEHPRALKAVEAIVRSPGVRHVVFGAHDFSRAMGISLQPARWPLQVGGYLHTLLLEARLAGCGVIAGVDTPIGQALLPPQCREREEIEHWLAQGGDAAAGLVYRHALEDGRLGFTGKQVIHPSHVRLAAAGLAPTPREIATEVEMLRFASDGRILAGGALKFGDRMIDRPMLEKGLQTLLRAEALGVLDADERGWCRAFAARLPPASLRDNWPYGELVLERGA